MNRDSNAYTFGFAAAMVVVVASVLAFTASSLKDLQQDNVRKEKMQNILATIGIETDREGAEVLFNKYIVSQLALRNDGTVDESVDPFSGIKLALELKKNENEQRFPLYLADVEEDSYYIIPLRGSGLWDALKKNENEQRFPLYLADVEEDSYYIIPLRGSGLWDAIWGYIALESDRTTIKGAVFDHKAETAGLGAEITQQWFMNRFVGEKVFAADGSLKGILVSKTNNDPKDLDKDDHEVDAISGATITGDGVSDMIYERLTHYQSYLTKNETTAAVAVNE